MRSAVKKAEEPTTVSVKDVELVNQLWKLKQRYQKHTGTYIRLSMLINDLDYRLSVLQGAARSGAPELVDLAAVIQQALSAAHEQPYPAPDQPSSTSSSANSTTKQRWPRLALLTTVTVVAITAALSLWPVAEHAPAATIASSTTTSPPTRPLPAQLPAPALRLHGSNTVGEELAPALVEALLRTRGYSDIRLVPGASSVEKTLYAFPQQELPELSVQIQAHGSSTAFQSLQDGSADMGMSSRPIHAKEITALRSQLGDLNDGGGEHVIALDGLAVIVHPSNPLSALNTQQIAQLFSGEITHWSRLGGHSLPVTVYARDHQSGTFDTFKNLVLKPHAAQLAATAHRFESSTELSDLVAQDVGAIGFIGLPYVRRAKALATYESTDAMAIVPTHFTVGTEDYPLSRRLFFYTPPAASNPLAAALAEFTLSREGQDIVEQVGFVSQNIRTEQITLDPALPAEYLELARGSRRLSLNFRFQPDSNQLDNKSQRDLQRLVDYLAEHHHLRVALLGFTDGADNPSYDMLLSQRRAETVEKALQARGVFPWATRGFGSAAPLASNTSPAGQQRNRRVEVWVR